MNTETIRIAIVDDQPIFRQSLRTILEKEPDVCVVAEAENGLDGIKLVEDHRPHVVLMDLSMPGMDAFQATRIISSRFPETRVIILSMYSDDRLKAISCQAGACYHLCKDECSPTDIVAAIRDGHHNRWG